MTTRVRQWGHRCALAVGTIVSVFVLAWNVTIGFLDWDRSSIDRAAGADSFIESQTDERSIARARYHLQRLLEDGSIPGLAVAVVRHGRLVWSEAVGFADVESQQRATRRTRFRIQSLSKSLTASTLMRLHERGDVDLDTPVQTYVPSFPDKGQPITLRQLASHRSGIRGYRDDREALSSGHCDRAFEAVASFQHDPLVYGPDTDSVYSNYGYMLLGAALEGATGRPFPEVVRHHVLGPLGMDGTVEMRAGHDDSDASVAYDFVTPYSRDGTRVRSPLLDFTCKWPSGGYLSTADDMARFAAAHSVQVRNPFLRRQSLDLQVQPRTPPGSPVGIALGWLVARDWRLRRVVFNFGAGSGGRAFLALYPDHDLAVAIVANLGHARMDMRRLIGVTAPFLKARHSPWPEAFGAFGLAGWAWFFRSRRKKN